MEITIKALGNSSDETVNAFQMDEESLESNSERGGKKVEERVRYVRDINERWREI